MLAKITMSKLLTPFSLQATLVVQMNMNRNSEYRFVDMTAFKRFVLISGEVIADGSASLTMSAATKSLSLPFVVIIF